MTINPKEGCESFEAMPDRPAWLNGYNARHDAGGLIVFDSLDQLKHVKQV